MHTYDNDCGHRTLADSAERCHRVGFAPCPYHFGQLFLPSLSMSLHHPTEAMVENLRHITADGFLASAFCTWAALLHRYAVPEGMDPAATLAGQGMTFHQTHGKPAPDHNLMVAYIRTTVRAALLGDVATLEATMAAAMETLGVEGTVSYLNSIAASAAANSGASEAFTREHYDAYATLGSQAGDGWGVVALPILVDMVFAHQGHVCCPFPQHVTELLPLFRKLVALDPRGNAGLKVSVDILTRVLGQTVSADVSLFDGDNQRQVDIENATVSDTPSLMPTVWVLRSAHAYGGATSNKDAMARLRAVVDRHGDTTRYAADLIIYGTQILADNLFSPAEESTG